MTRNTLKKLVKKGIIACITFGIISQNVQSISAVSLLRIKEYQNEFGPYYGIDINEYRPIENQKEIIDKQEPLGNLKQFSYEEESSGITQSDEFIYEESVDEVTTIYVNEEDDNLKQMVISSVPENYFDGEGFQPIETTLEETQEEYINDTNTVTSSYSKDIENGLVFSVEGINVYYKPILGTYETQVHLDPEEESETLLEDEEVYFGEDNVLENTSEASLEDNDIENEIIEEDIQDVKQPEAVSQIENPWVYENQIIYPLSNEINIRYSVFNGYIREDIILNTIGNHHTYSYEINVENGFIELIQNELYVYNHSGQAVLALGAPRAYDASNQETEVFLYYEDGILTYEVDEEWLNSEERVYPIIIDPDFRQIMAHEGMDTSVIQNEPYMTVGNIDLEPLNWRITDIFPARLYIGKDPDYGDSVSFYKVRSDTLSEFSGKYIKSAIANFPIYETNASGSVYGCTISSNYDIGTAVYNNVEDALNNLGNCISVDYQKDTDSIDFDITDYVKGVVELDKVNSGVLFLLKKQDHNWLRLNSAEYYNYENGMGIEHGHRYPGTVIEYYENPEISDDMDTEEFTYELRPFVQYNKNEGLINFIALSIDGKAPYLSDIDFKIINNDQEIYSKRMSAFDNFYRFPDYPEIIDVPSKWIELESNYQLDEFIKKEDLDINKVYDVEVICKKDDKETKKTTWFQIIEVSEFDLLEKIATFYDIDIEVIKEDNNLEDNLITNGNILFLREPKRNQGKAYPHTNLSNNEKAQIDALLRGRNVECEFGNEPINFNTGNFLIETEDFGLHIEGETFHFERIYNSLGSDEYSDIGYGWSHNLNSTIVKNRDGATLLLENSKKLYFKEENGNYTNSFTDRYALRYEENHFVLTDQDTQSVYHFLSNGMLGLIEDRNGKKRSFEYNEHLQLIKVILENGESIHFEYNEQHLLTNIKYQDKQVSYEYDENNDLIVFKDVNGNQVEYSYDENHRMISWIDRNGNPVVTNTYDNQNRVIKQVDGLGNIYNTEYQDHKTFNTDPNGNKTIYEYDEYGATKKISYSNNDEIIKQYNKGLLTYLKDERGIETTYSYDENRNVIKKERSDGFIEEYEYNDRNNLIHYQNNEGQWKSRVYNDRNQIISSTNSLGITSYKTYDEAGNLVSETDENGNTTSYTYNEKNQLIGVIYPDGSSYSYTYNSDGFLANTTDKYGNTTYYNHNERNELVLVTNPDGTTIKYEYDKNGNQTAIEDENGNITKYTYDIYGNVISQKDPLGNLTNYEYDGNQNIVKITYPDNSFISYSYDSRNRIIEEDHNGHITKYTYNTYGIESITNEHNQVLTYSYDSLGNLIKEIGYDGLEKSYEYNKLNQLIKETNEKGSDTTYEYDLEGRLTKKETKQYTEEYTYDNNGNRLSLSYKSEDSEYTLNYAYNAMNRLIEESDALGNKEYYEYDGIRFISQIDKKGDKTRFEYDNRDRLIKEVLSDGSIRSYTYDGVGNKLSEIDTNGNKQSYIYDGNHNLILHTDGRGNQTSYSYDPMNLLLTSILPLGYKESYEYDIDGNLLSKKIHDREVETYEYDSYGRLLKETKSGLVTTYEYDENDEVIKKIENSGLTYEYTYDFYHRVLQVKKNDEIEKEFTYDDFDNVLTEKDLYGEKRTNEYNSDNRLVKTSYHNLITEYEYDSNGQVIKESDSLGNIKESTYDENGNLIKEEINGESSIYDYDSDNQLISITNRLGNQTIYEKDHEGNLVSTTNNNGYKTEYLYDENYNLIKTIVEGKTIQENQYNEDNLLIKEIDGEGFNKQYAYDSFRNLIKRVNERGYAYEYAYDEKFNLLEEKDPKGNKTTYTYNELNQITKKKDSLGYEYTYEYDIFGNTISIKNPLGSIETFTYNTKNQLIETKDNRGLVSTHTYNSFNLVTEIKKNDLTSNKYTYDSYGRLVSEENSLGAKTSYSYDKAGNRVSLTKPNGGKETYRYDSENQLIEKIDVLGTKSIYEYDGEGQLIKETIHNERSTSYEYDSLGNLTQKEDAKGNITKYTYNLRNELIEKEDALGGITKYEYSQTGELLKEIDPRGNETNYTIDELGQVIQTKDPLGHLITNTYDSLGHLISVQNARGYTTNYEYNALGSLTKEYTSKSQTVYKYNNANDLLETKDNNRKKESYSYDIYGNLVTFKQKNGEIINYSYDTENQLFKKNNITYEYDLMGNLTQMNDESGLTTFTYNLKDSLLSTHQLGNTVTYTYNPYNEVESITYPDQSKVTYIYDLNGKYQSVKYTGNYNESVTYEYDALNRETKETRNHNIITTTSYDKNGNITNKKTISNGQTYLELSYEYNENNSLIKETKKQLNKTSIKVYEYNENDELISSTLTTNNETSITKYIVTLDGNLSEVTNGSTTSRNEYNESNQIIKSYHDGHTYTYTYDDNGNRTLEKRDDGAIRSYEYDEFNRLITLKDYDNAYYEYTYEGLDNRIKQYSIRRGQHYIDGEYIIEDKMDKLINRLKVASSSEYGNLCLVEYYDEEEVPDLPTETKNTYTSYQEKIGEEISYHSEPGICLVHDLDVSDIIYVNDYTYDHVQVLTEQYNQENINYLFGNGRISSSRSEYIDDYQNTVLETLNHSGTIKTEYEYTDYGRRDSAYDIYNSYDDPIGYNGEYHESSELIYLRARYYDPNIYIFTIEDTYRGILYDPSSRNRYAYGRRNPKKYLDPSGHYLNQSVMMADNGGGARSYKNHGGCIVTPPTPTYTPPVRDYSRAYERAEAYTQTKQYVSQSVQTTYNQKIEAQAAWNQHVQKQERIEQQITKYSYTKGGNTSVVTAEEAKKEAVQVHQSIKEAIKSVIGPQAKKNTTANSKTNSIKINLENSSKKFDSLFNKTSGSLEDRAKQACDSYLFENYSSRFALMKHSLKLFSNGLNSGIATVSESFNLFSANSYLELFESIIIVLCVAVFTVFDIVEALDYLFDVIRGDTNNCHNNILRDFVFDGNPIDYKNFQKSIVEYIYERDSLLTIQQIVSVLLGFGMSDEGEIINTSYDRYDIQQITKTIPEQYKSNFKCEEFKDALIAKISKTDINYEEIRIESPFAIYSDNLKTAIAYPGNTKSYHVAIKIESYVYDNNYPYGIRFIDWLNDLGYYSGQEIHLYIK